MNLSIRNSNYHITTWAVIGGTAVALSVEVVLNLLGIGLGLTNMNLTLNSLFKTGIGAVIWLAVSGCISMAVGGWVAGKLSGANTWERIMHGLLAWSFATLIAVLAATSAAGAFIGGPTSVIGSSMGSRVSQQAVSNMRTPSGVENSGSDQQSTAETAGEGIGGASIAMFVAFLLSAAASMIAASRAKSRDDTISDEARR